MKYEKACSDFTENEWRTISETGQGKGYGYHLKGHRLPNVLALICEGKQSCNVDILLEFLDEPFRCVNTCLLYTSPSPRDGLLSRMPSSA